MEKDEYKNIEQDPLNEEHINSEGNSPKDLSSTCKTKQKKSHFKMVLSGIIGGVISAAIILLLVTTNLLPFTTNSGEAAGSTIDDNSNTEEFIPTIASAEDGNISSNIEEVSEAVVGVINMQRQSIWTSNEEAGSGSGIIYKKENGKAYVVTNQHVVDRAEEVEVALNNDTRLKAKVLGTDALTDLAILQVDGDKIKTIAKLGDSKDLKVGETVFALGNPLGMEFANSLTKGIISGLNRSVSIDTNGDRQPDWVTEVIQTDAAINPGNSGGALIKANGEVIGINSMKIARQEVEGIGFAIPINSALPIMEQLETKGEVSRPFIGISVATLNQVPPQYRSNVILPDGVEEGMVIASVETGSPADEAGLQQFDVITKINNEEVSSILELRKYMYSETAIGDTVKIEFYRNGKKEMAELKLTERTDV